MAHDNPGPSPILPPPVDRSRAARRMYPLSWVGLVLLGGAAGLLLGCQNDEIRHYRVPHAEAPAPLPATGTPTRLVAAIFPQPDRTWFFKLTGPPAEVAAHKDEFDRFLQTIRFTGQEKPPVTWTVPAGWKQEPGSELRYATFRFGSKEAPLELTVVPLEGKAGELLDNVNRWRKQIGLRPINAAELDKVSAWQDVNGVNAVLVDMEGTASPGSGKMPPFASGRPGATAGTAVPPTTPAGPLTYNVPSGWKDQTAPGGMSVASFRVVDGNHFAEVTVIPLPGAAGGLLGNVNRWRGQIGLPPASPEQLRQDLRPITVDGSPAQYVALVGPEAAGARRESILAVLAVREGQTWFFKMKGPADLVARQQPAFEAFVKSVHFGGTGAKP